MSAPARPLAVIAAALALAAAGCGPSSNAQSSSSTRTKILEAGDEGKGATPAFATSGLGVRVDYRLVQPSRQAAISFSAEREAASGAFQIVSTVSQPVPESLVGSASLSLIPGRYRIRVDTDVPWTAVISEAK